MRESTSKSRELAAGEHGADCSNHYRWVAVVIISTASIAFSAGYLTCAEVGKRHIEEMAAQKFKEFLVIGRDLGIINEQRLTEVISASAEDEPLDEGVKPLPQDLWSD